MGEKYTFFPEKCVTFSINRTTEETSEKLKFWKMFLFEKKLFRLEFFLLWKEILNKYWWTNPLIFTHQIHHVNEPQAGRRRPAERSSSSLGSKCKFVIFMCIYKWLCLAVKTAATSWNRSTNCQLGVWVMSGGSLYRVLVQNQNLKPRWSCNFFFRLTNGSHHKS